MIENMERIINNISKMSYARTHTNLIILFAKIIININIFNLHSLTR